MKLEQDEWSDKDGAIKGGTEENGKQRHSRGRLGKTVRWRGGCQCDTKEEC